MKKHPSLCFRTEKTLLSCLQTASLLTSDDIVSKSLRALTCLELVILKYCDLCQQIADLAPTRSSAAHLQKQGLLTRLMFFRMIPAWQMTDADSLHHTLDILKCPFPLILHNCSSLKRHMGDISYPTARHTQWWITLLRTNNHQFYNVILICHPPPLGLFVWKPSFWLFLTIVGIYEGF